MNGSNYNIYKKVAGGALAKLLITLCMVCVSAQAAGQLRSKYTKEKPLIIICDWEFPPYEYSNDNGKPDGFNVELLDGILDEIGLPHKFVMKESFLVNDAFRHREADLIIDATSRFRSATYQVSRNILNYYRIMVATNKSQTPVSSFGQLDPSKTVALKSYDYATRDLLSHIAPATIVKYHSINEGLVSVYTNKDYCFVWGEEPIKWFIREMNLTNISLQDFNIPATEVRMVGYDKQLIDEIDDQYARWEQSGRLERLRDKWFRPEQRHDDTSPIAVYALTAILLLAALLFLLNRFAKRRAVSATRKTKETEGMLLQALGVSQYAILTLESKTLRFINQHGQIMPKAGATLEEALTHVHPEERPVVKKYITELLKGERENAELRMRWLPFESNASQPSGTTDEWQYIQGHAITERDSQGNIPRLVISIKYVTEEVRQEQAISQLSSRYSKIFDTSMVAMSLYTKEGQLVNLNQKMRELCGFNEETEKLFRDTNLFDVSFLREDFNPSSREQFHVCEHLHLPEIGIDKYIELKILPVTDESGNLSYFTITIRDVTDERHIHLEQLQHDHELQKINRQINEYEEQLHYLLEHSDLWVWTSDLKTQSISFSRSLRKKEFHVSFEDFAKGISPNQRENVLEAFGNLHGADRNFNKVALFDVSPINGGMQWLSASGIPLYDASGKVKGHFGIVRDVTRLMNTQEQLRRETKRADESGKLKSVFLANMTHEIRTPLNAIVGFSDLLPMIDEPSERQEFIRIIRNNCDMLLRLIDDIIEASNMNHGPIAIELSDVDWAQAFNDICQTLAQRVQEPDVEFIVDNPYSTFLTCLDKGRMQQVITNFTTNAVKYTHQGHIKVGYRYEEGGIYMYCEDTGAGIPKDKQAAVFDRFVKLNDFVQGTGLGLSICKSIADRCGGKIGVNSEGEGHGSTFWIWIPCEHKQQPTTTHD